MIGLLIQASKESVKEESVKQEKLIFKFSQTQWRKPKRLSLEAASDFIIHVITDCWVQGFLMGHPLLDLTDKTAVVIGGTSGIGLALTRALAQAGANVVPTGRRSAQVAAAASEVQALGRGP